MGEISVAVSGKSRDAVTGVPGLSWDKCTGWGTGLSWGWGAGVGWKRGSGWSPGSSNCAG
jgi:hypothetical protein